MNKKFLSKKVVSIFYLISIALLFELSNGCQPKIENAKELNYLPRIIPDYTEIVIPPNIAPLNFYINESGIQYVAEFKGKNGYKFVIRSKDGVIDIPIEKWEKLLKNNVGQDFEIIVYLQENSRNWVKYKAIKNTVSSDSLDQYLAYRLINNGNVLWNKMGLYVRNLSNFEETPIIENNLIQNDCINCHSFWRNSSEKFLFHVRGRNKGTVLYAEQKCVKLNTKTPYTMTPAVYPSWHPSGKFVAFSVNRINQSFHNYSDELIEVFDKASDLVVYNIDKNELTTCPEISTSGNETYPNWSADGKYLYYCLAPKWSNSIPVDSFRYSLMRIAFDPQTNTWGKPDTVISAYRLRKSVTFPRVSPDGKFLMFCLSNHGCFSIFYPSSDLYILDLTTNEIKKLPVNSNQVDSYHSWSSTGRWFVFSSKRMNHIHTRPFFSHFDTNGNVSKPFVLPMKNPHYFESFLRNYNIPEFVRESLPIVSYDLAKIIKSSSLDVGFDSKVNIDALSGATKIKKQ